MDLDMRPGQPAAATQAKPQLIRVWFGRYSIAAYQADKLLADRYAAVMSTSFAGLRITTEPVTGEISKPWLPDDERQWALTAFGGAGR
jgi:hypothetical protein